MAMDKARLSRIGASALVIMLVMLAMSGQMGSKICRLCFGADIHMGECLIISCDSCLYDR